MLNYPYDYISRAVIVDKDRRVICEVQMRTYTWGLHMLSRVLDQMEAKVRAAGFGECNWACSLGKGQEGHFSYPDATGKERTAVIAFWRV